MTSESAPPDFNPQRWIENWLQTPHPALGNYTPGSLLDTDAGRHRVIDLLGQIAAGAYA